MRSSLNKITITPAAILPPSVKLPVQQVQIDLQNRFQTQGVDASDMILLVSTKGVPIKHGTGSVLWQLWNGTIC